MAGSCHKTPHKNPKLLPAKWAKTSVVILLQHPHNPNVQIPNLSPRQKCTANRELITFSIAIFPSLFQVVAPSVRLLIDVRNLARAMHYPLEFGALISTITLSASTVISTT